MHRLTPSHDHPLSRPPATVPAVSHPSLHPLLHRDIFPQILARCSERTTARLMSVSRSILGEVVLSRWPIITVNILPKHRVIPPHTSLPVDALDFSFGMTLLLSQFSPTVRIFPHHADMCKQHINRAGQRSLARTILVDRMSLCHPYSTPTPPTPCGLCRLFTPTTLRIDGLIFQNPIFGTPPGIYFAPTLTRLVICIEPGTPAFPLLIFPGLAPLHSTLPDHIVDIVFILSRLPPFHWTEVVKRDRAITLRNLGISLARWMGDGRRGVVEGRQWTIVGAERFGSRWLPEMEEGRAVFLGGQWAILAGIAKGLERYSVAKEVMSRVYFVKLQEYLQRSETRSELSAEEISLFVASERQRIGKLRKREAERIDEAERARLDPREVFARRSLIVVGSHR